METEKEKLAKQNRIGFMNNLDHIPSISDFIDGLDKAYIQGWNEALKHVNENLSDGCSKLHNSVREKEILKTPSEDQTQLEDRPETGYKNDRIDDKLRWELLPWQEIEDIVKVYHFGAKKYTPESWKNLNDGARRYFAACNRHLIAYIKGEKIDPESGIYHLAHAAWNVIAMLYLDKHGNGFDFDRVKTDKFIEKACIVHNNKYKYPNTIYVKNDEKVEVECPIHGAFWQTPHNHLNGAGCPKCGNRIDW